jgi:hypothetical protein
MINQAMQEANQDAPDDFRRLLIAQLTHCRDMLNDYLDIEGRGYGEGKMPHEWGSVDSVDYMMAALDLSSEFLNEGVLGDPTIYLTKLGAYIDEEEPDPLRYYEATFACDGVAPEIYKYYEGDTE